MVELRIFGTPVKIKGTVLIPIVALWGIVTCTTTALLKLINREI